MRQADREEEEKEEREREKERERDEASKVPDVRPKVRGTGGVRRRMREGTLRAHRHA